VVYVYQDDATRCKEKHVNNPGQEIEHCSRRKRRPPIRNEDFFMGIKPNKAFTKETMHANDSLTVIHQNILAVKVMSLFVQ
jgi:hypothetical protein